MRPNQIRPLALDIFIHDGKILAMVKRNEPTA